MSFFAKKREELSPWQLPWTLIWRDDSWLTSMLSKGLVPVLAGVDLVMFALGEGELIDYLHGEGFRYVLGFVRASENIPKDFEELLGPDMFEKLKSSIRPEFNFDPKKSEFTISSTDMNMTVCTGLREGLFWPDVEDYCLFVAPHQGDNCTGLVYYSDPEEKIHQFSTPVLEMVENGFVAPLPEGLGGEHESAWGVFKKTSE